jgi:hypothetical protein
MWVTISSQDQRVLIMIILLDFLFLEMKIRVLTKYTMLSYLAVIRVRKFELNRFICPFYSAQTLLNTWSGHFYPYPNQIDWLESNSPRIIPQQRLIRRGRRNHIHLSMIMDEMVGRQVKRGSRLESNNNNTGIILVSK